VKICHKENVTKMFPFHLFLLPRCENFAKKKTSPKCSHFIYFCRQDVKNLPQRKNVTKMFHHFCLFLLPRCENLSICHKENFTKIMFPISFISVAKTLKFATKKKSRQNGPISFIICQKENAHQFPPVQHIYRQIRTWVQQRAFFLKCNLPWTVPLVLDLQ